MTDLEQDEFERCLQSIKPARPPENLSKRLQSLEPTPKAEVRTASSVEEISILLQIMRHWRRWLVSGSAVTLALLLAWKSSLQLDLHNRSVPIKSQSNPAAATTLVKVDDVKIDQKLVSSFDAVARLPSGEPVRFRCENWMDQVVMSDKAGGLVVENCKPRVEVAAIGFETY
jgi:hypothetical protein